MGQPIIPRTMSTQHPDNVRTPFFSEHHVLGGDDELKEAFYCFSHLKITEQLWDFEGKDVDNSVVRKLLMRYEPYFKDHQLGKDVFLTYRVPNPEVEKNEAKILLETLESIPRNYDTAKIFYGKDCVPVFEVAMPMTTNAESLIRISEYYKQFVYGKQNNVLFKGDKPISSWLGTFAPSSVKIIPLFEDKDSILNADKMVERFMTHQKIKDYQRVWLARSDPALNYGSFGTVLIEKIALQRLHKLSKRLGVPIHPILGCGSAPFRGNFKPTNVKENVAAYPSVQTFTLQSAFKYDFDEAVVKEAVKYLESTKASAPLEVDEKALLPIIEKTALAYQKDIDLIAPMINAFSSNIPKRRTRKLHIGLFGYSRKHKGTTLPRAISFCGSLYSMGLPPEILGMHVLSQDDIKKIKHAYPSLEQDMKDALQFINTDTLSLFPAEVVGHVKKALTMFDCPINREHKKVTSIIVENFRQKDPVLTENIERAGWIRGFLG